MSDAFCRCVNVFLSDEVIHIYIEGLEPALIPWSSGFGKPTKGARI